MNLVTMILACSLYPDNSITNAMVELGSQNNPLTITITDNGQNTTKTFKNEADALSYANKEIAQEHTVNIGLLQIPNSFIAKFPADMGANVAGLLRPCKNMVVATDLLNDAAEQCAAVDGDKTSCALSVYHTGSPTAGLDYAKEVIAYAVAHPFVKPPSILEQVPATPDNTAIENANNNLQGDVPNTNSAVTANSTNTSPASNNSSTNNVAQSVNGNSENTNTASNTSSNNDQTLNNQVSINAQPSQDESNSSQDNSSDSSNLPPVVNGDNSSN